jgi:hypothetical protein
VEARRVLTFHWRYPMSGPQRAYCGLRDIIERHGGTMAYHREGFRHGAWVISLGSRTATIEATGEQSFPPLDRLYVPKVVNPTRWDHYRDELLDDAEEHLLTLLK